MPITIHPNDGKYSISINGSEKKYKFASSNDGDAEARKVSLKNPGKLIVLKKLEARGPGQIVSRWRSGQRV